MDANTQNMHSRMHLEQLAGDVGVYMNQRSPQLARKDTVSSFNQEDREAAEALARQKRLDTFSSKSHIFRRAPSKRSFRRDEIYSAMDTIIRNDSGSIGVLECLLAQSKEAKSNKSLFKKTQSDAMGIDLGDLLRLATEKRNPNIVEILAPHVDQWGLNSSLGLAVTGLDLKCIKVLLQNGADPNGCQQGFLTAVMKGNISLIELLLGAETKLELPCVDQALPIALSVGSLRVVIMLLQNGANADLNQVLEMSVRAGRLDITAALVLADQPPSHISLDRAAGIAFHITNLEDEERHKVVEMLLCAGGNGENVAKALVNAVIANNEKLASLIVSYNGDVTYNSCESMITAIERGNFKMLDILFQGPIDGEAASVALTRITRITTHMSPTKKLSIISNFVGCGAYGVPLHECLVNAVKNNEQDLIELLVDNNASVDYDNAHVLRLAISTGSLSILKKLLQRKPSQDSVIQCFGLLHSVPARLQVSIVTELLAAGAKGEGVDKALLGAVSGEFPAEREHLIELFVQHGADVNVCGGKCFEEAVLLGDVVTINLLLQGTPSPLSLSQAIIPATSLRDRVLRFSVLDLLLSAGARGALIDQELISLLNEDPVDIVAINLFLEKGKADVNANNGKPFEQVCRNGDPNLLKILMQHRPSVTTLNTAFPLALMTRDVSARYKMCHRLLIVGVNGETIDSGLVATYSNSPNDSQLIELLLQYGANVNFNNGSVIRKAIKICDEKHLALFVSRMPTSQTLVAALEVLLKTDTKKTYEMGKILLDASYNRIPEVIDNLLPEAIRLNKGGIPFFQLVLQHGASVDYQKGLAIRLSIEGRRFDVLDLLLNQSVNLDTLEIAFTLSWALKGGERLQYTARVLEAGYKGEHLDAALLETVQETACDHDLTKLLLGYGASVHHERSQCLIHAATTKDVPTLALLLECVSDRASITYAFGKVVSMCGDVWLTTAGFSTVDLLLRHGASGEVLSLALVSVIETPGANAELLEFVDLFLRYGASVDYQDGRALSAAVAAGQPGFVREMLKSSPSSHSQSIAFSCILSSNLTEDVTLELIELFTTKGNLDIQELNKMRHSDDGQEDPVTFVCLKRWPRGTKVLGRLLQAGIHVDKTIPFTIEQEEGLEHVSLLLWALLQPQQRISPYVIECLLTNGADPNFQSTGSLKTPILVAAKDRTPDIVLKLIQHGADVSVTDKHGETPLLSASKRGQISIMRHIIDSGAIVDDGSIHEAALSLQPAAVELLLAHGHNPNFPSMLHDGRCALAELCLKVSDVGISAARIRQTIDSLVAGKADLTVQSQGKPLLVHALDNPLSCITVTTALLASGMWKFINNDFNLYTVNGYVYSPTMYVKSNLPNSPIEHGPQLLRILEANGCKEVFYKQDGPQPPDMVGAPPEIIAEEKRRKNRIQRLQEQEEEHQISLQRERETADQQHNLMSRTHNLRVLHDRETTDERDAATERSARLQFRLEADSATQRQRLADQQRASELEQQQRLNQLRLDTTERQGRLQIEQEKTSVQTQQSLLDSKMATESRRIQELEAANERQYQRDSDLLTRQERVMAERKNMMSSGQDGLPSSAAPQGQLTYSGTELD